jgi:hypothetical protein
MTQTPYLSHHLPENAFAHQAAHKVLTEEHSALLNRQVGTASQRTSLRQELLTLEEQYMAARAQVRACLRSPVPHLVLASHVGGLAQLLTQRDSYVYILLVMGTLVCGQCAAGIPGWCRQSF